MCDCKKEPEFDQVTDWRKEEADKREMSKRVASKIVDLLAQEGVICWDIEEILHRVKHIVIAPSKEAMRLEMKKVVRPVEVNEDLI